MSRFDDTDDSALGKGGASGPARYGFIMIAAVFALLAAIYMRPAVSRLVRSAKPTNSAAASIPEEYADEIDRALGASQFRQRPSSAGSGRAQIDSARALWSDGRPEQAKALYRQALRSILVDFQSETALKANTLLCGQAAEAALRLERASDAAPLVRHLQAIGYSEPNFVAACEEAGVAQAPASAEVSEPSE